MSKNVVFIATRCKHVRIQDQASEVLCIRELTTRGELAHKKSKS